MCCSPWGRKESDTTELTELKMDLEGMMHCEKNKTEKDKYFMISLIRTQKKTKIKNTKLKEKEVRSMVLRDRRKEVGRLEKAGQKLESSS